ncbi:hypothetical protein WA026_015340 [Henosepilachna vigintioctopunctata]|uniref:RNA-directed DNA polymerase from mobile element jockey n=1 Tax=Henosepilachna vigintioctopunctata TaxID=420089 RepID=A0AAW1UL27_9CUCU
MACWNKSYPFFILPKQETSATNLKPSRQNSQLSNSCKATSSNQRMKIMHLNIQGITNKIEALENLTSHLKTDVICLSEHWLHEGNKGLYQMENRRLASGYNRQQHQHGGVCLYIDEGILYSKISEIKNFSNEMTNEVCAIYLSEQNLVVLSFYAAKLRTNKNHIFKHKGIVIEEDVISCIGRLASKPTMDIYDISSTLVKVVAEAIVYPLTDIIQADKHV